VDNFNKNGGYYCANSGVLSRRFAARRNRNTDVSTDVLVETIFRVLRDWRLSTMAQGDEPTEGYPLVDAVSTPNGTIESGETELGEIAATIAEALQRSNAEKDEALEVCALVLESQGAYQTAQHARKALSHSSETSK